MTATTATSRPPVAATGTTKRTDIQGLRAVAVTMVIAYHFFPGKLTGGFVGVDVFFVISGYLITLLLLREVERTGTVSLTAFYARRIRRLMPAALATTAATVVVAWLVLDPVSWTGVLHDASWTSAYLANVHFSLQPDGYFAATTKSPLLHTWSLAVEEQYYVLWPAILLGLVTVARGRLRQAVPAVLLFLLVASFAASVVLTGSGSSLAYYSIGTRAWELALGGAVAYAVSRGVVLRGDVASGAVLVGIAAAVAAALTFSDATPFPGYAALLPTAGTALAIWAGTGRTTAIDRLLRVRAIQSVGDASYSLYLWHWPVLVLGTEALGSSRSDRVALVALAWGLGFAGHRWIERPTARLGHRVSARRFVAGGLAVAVVAVLLPAVLATRVSVAGTSSVADLPAVDARVAVRDGAVTLERDPGLSAPAEVPANVTPPLPQLADDVAEVFTNGCYSSAVVVCDGGDPRGDVTVVLAGDSHAGQWWPGLDVAARARGWKLSMVGKNACPLADIEVNPGEDNTECSRWQRDALAAVVGLDPDVVVYDNHAQGYLLKPGMAEDFEDRWTSGVLPVLEELTRHSTVVALGQTPSFDWDPATCLGSHLSDVAACARPTRDVRLPLIRRLTEKLAREGGATYFDPTLLLCDDSCPMMDRNAIVYRDSTHIGASYSAALAGALGAVVEAALEAGDGDRPASASRAGLTPRG